MEMDKKSLHNQFKLGVTAKGTELLDADDLHSLWSYAGSVGYVISAIEGYRLEGGFEYADFDFNFHVDDLEFGDGSLLDLIRQNIEVLVQKAKTSEHPIRFQVWLRE